jgi:hypothetical protein
MGAGLTAEQVKELEALNLTQRQREMMERTLENSPMLSVQEAYEELKAGGM